MDINAGNINALTASVNLAFNKYLTTGPSQYQRFCQIVPSTSGENFYPKLAELPGLKRFIGQRQINMLSTSSYSIVNETYEETIGIKREDIEDDKWGVFTPFIEQLGQDAAELPDQLSFGVLQNGHKTTGIDGQYFFDTDHMATNANGQPFAYSNIGVPQGTEAAVAPWYLMCTTRALKPIIYQPRRPFVVTSRTQLQSGNVFNHRRFEWGVDGRCAAGVGLWQLAYKSTRPITIASFNDALAAMASLCRLDGTPYGIVPDLMVVPSNLQAPARTLLKAQLAPLSAGNDFATGTNPWQNAAELMVAPRLSQLAG